MRHPIEVNPMPKNGVIVVLILFMTSLISIIMFRIGQEESFAMPSGGEEADLILREGTIVTVNESQAWAEAVAVKDGQIIFVGANSEVGAYQGAQTRVIRLEGRLVLPGLHDSHLHPLEAGSSVAGTCSLPNDGSSAEAMIPILQACAPNQIGTEWVLGHGFSIFSLLEGERLPVEILDEAIPDKPAAMLEETSHALWVNSLALQAAGFDANSPNPPGGVIDKDKQTGEPSGLLIDNAGNMVMDLALARSDKLDQLNYEGLLDSLDLLAENGITSIADARAYWQRGHLEAWQRAEQEETLTVRAVLGLWAYPAMDDQQQIESLTALYSNDPERLLRISQVKMYSDGIIPNGTAALLEPYNFTPSFTGNLGLNYFDETRLTEYVTALEQVGFDLKIHAIGDRAVREALNAIEAARNSNGDGIERRHHLTHVELVHADDYNRFAKLGVIADFQVGGDLTDPAHFTDTAEFIGSRALDLVPVRTIYDTGAVVTLSSDWDVTPLNPFNGIERSLMRDEQSLPDVDAAVRAYTINAAYLMRQEDRVGSIEVGKLADLIVVNQNIFTVPTEQISETTVLLTLLEGEEIYRDASFGGMSQSIYLPLVKG